MQEVMDITKALADDNRVRILMFMEGGELCVCQIVEMLGLAPSTVSKHVAILHRAGLLESRKVGRWVYYRLPGDAFPRARGVIEWLRDCLAADPQVAADRRRLESVLNMNRDQLCVRYHRAEKASVRADV
jgi:ArsR family transcriptional regulator